MRSPSLLAVALVAAARTAHAQSGPTDSDVATRRELINQAQHASDAGDHRVALDLASRAGRIQMTPSLRDFVAGEQSALGLLADALGSAELCEHDAQADAHALDRENVIRDCHELATQLRPRVARVVVTVPTPAPTGLTVTVGGRALNEAFYGVPYVVDPGHLVVEASATGCAPFHGEADVTAGGTATLDVQLAVVAEPVASATSSATSTATSAAPEPPRGVLPAAPRPSLAGPIAVMGGGAAVLLAGVLFGIAQLDSLADCGLVLPDGSRVCTGGANDPAHLALTWTVFADVGYIVGGAALAAGGAWLIASLVGHGGPARPGGPSAALDVAPAPGGGLVLGLRGTL